MEEDNNTDVFGGLDWYRAKTVEEMRNDLITMANGNYFNDEASYVFMAGGKVVIRSGFDLNDQAPEGPGAEEYQQMSDEQIVQQYVSRIKMYPPLVSIADQQGFAEAYLPALDNMNNVASVFGNDVQYGDGMTMASEIQTGAIDDYIQTGFKDTKEFYEWYLRDVAPHQAVMQPGQKQAEDFSIVDADFYEETTPPPNTRFPRKPQTQPQSTVFKQDEDRQSIADRFGEAVDNIPVGPVTEKIREGGKQLEESISRSYYGLLEKLTKVGDGIKAKNNELIDRDNQFFLETQTNNVPLKDIIARLQEFRDNNDN
jgi:hypothetical protein